MKRWVWVLACVSIALVACAGGVTQSDSDGSIGATGNSGSDGERQSDVRTTSEFVGSVPAPDFPAGLDWINVPAPLTLDALRGKVVLLDFWTYGCINCIHMIPILEQLEEKYPDELVVIGVHSAKFVNEGQTDNIRQIVQRYDRRHPVINDSNFLVWSTFGAQAWPTFAIIDPNGNLFAMQAGEIPFEAFDNVVGGMVEHFDSIGELNREPLELALEGANNPGTPLLFPGKVLADGAGNRLFIADSSHHRVVVADLETYEVLQVIGTGQRGFDDGDFETATFDKPQGMALDGDTLFLADTNNHAIRAIDLQTNQVTTFAGDGQQGTEFVPFGTPVTDPLDFSLRSPWDVEFGADDTLYIAMAGTHQIWSLELEDNTLQSVVGNGREALLNSAPARSELAQPSGLYFVDGLLYFADSESSSIRVADFNEDRVRTVSGPDENTLFDFGDVDGVVGTSRLQHPLGVVGGPDGLVYITDTYNSRVKVIDPATDETSTLFGLGEVGGFRDGTAGEAQFDEPGGLDYADGILYVADTNNHAIRVIDLESETVSTLTFPNPEALQMEAAVTTIVGGNEAAGETITLPQQALLAGDGEIVLQYRLPDGFQINDLIDSVGMFSSGGEAITLDETDVSLIVETEEVRIPVSLSEGSDTLTADLTLFYCRYGEQGLCFIDDVSISAPVTVGNDSDSSTILLERSIEPPEL